MTSRIRATSCLLAFACLGAAHAVPVQWTSASGGNDHWYELVTGATQITWNDANTAANTAGGHLATITSAAENDFVSAVANDLSAWSVQSWASFGPWLGGFQAPAHWTEVSTNWEWVTGEAWTYTNWLPSQPDNWTNNQEESLQFAVLPSAPAPPFGWNDAIGHYVEPSSTPYGYLVEYETVPPLQQGPGEPVPEPSTLALLGLGAAGLLRRRRA